MNCSSPIDYVDNKYEVKSRYSFRLKLLIGIMVKIIKTCFAIDIYAWFVCNEVKVSFFFFFLSVGRKHVWEKSCLLSYVQTM